VKYLAKLKCYGDLWRKFNLWPTWLIVLGLVFGGLHQLLLLSPVLAKKAEHVVTYHIGTHLFNLETARTPAQVERGLMFRNHLDPKHGMVFYFTPPRPVAFWMKNCRIALDILFIQNHRIVKIIHQAPPCKTNPCPIYPADDLIDEVVEIGGGQAKALQLKVGDTATIVH